MAPVSGGAALTKTSEEANRQATIVTKTALPLTILLPFDSDDFLEIMLFLLRAGLRPAFG
jgi:hypothetical protein